MGIITESTFRLILSIHEGSRYKITFKKEWQKYKCSLLPLSPCPSFPPHVWFCSILEEPFICFTPTFSKLLFFTSHRLLKTIWFFLPLLLACLSTFILRTTEGTQRDGQFPAVSTLRYEPHCRYILLVFDCILIPFHCNFSIRYTGSHST